MPGKEWDAHGPAARVEVHGEPGEGVGGVAEAVHEQRGPSRVAVERDRLGAADVAVGAQGEALSDLAAQPLDAGAAHGRRPVGENMAIS